MDKDEKIKKKYENTGYSAKYDAYFKIETGEWLEPVCSNPDCDICVGRPVNYYELFDPTDIERIKQEYSHKNRTIFNG